MLAQVILPRVGGGGRSWRRALGVGLVQELNHAESLTREDAQLHARRLTGNQSAQWSLTGAVVHTGSRRACVPAGGIPPNNHILFPGRWPRTLLSLQSPESGCLQSGSSWNFACPNFYSSKILANVVRLSGWLRELPKRRGKRNWPFTNSPSNKINPLIIQG